MPDTLEQTPDQQADALAGSGLRTIAKRALPRGAPVEEATKPPPKVNSAEEFEALAPGSDFLTPQGETKTKPWRVETPEDFELVPEGADFQTPKGDIITKPRYEDVGFTAQTLYDMAVNDRERRNALERSYPGKVKEMPSGKLYVDDDGVPRRPKGYLDNPSYVTGGAKLLASAAPVAGSVAGEIAGGIGGSALPGPGTLAGAIGGAAAGGAAGQGFNDIILGLAGVYDRSAGEEAAALGLSAAAGGAGTAAGRTLSSIAPYVKIAAQRGAPVAAAAFFGADKEGLEQALALREKGVLVPPSTWAKESPHLINIAQVFDPAFRTQKPLLQSATKHYEKSAAALLDRLGIKVEGRVSEPIAAPSTRAAGEALLAHRVEAQAAADRNLETTLAEYRSAAAMGAEAKAGSRKAVESAAASARKEAQQLVDLGFHDIQKSVDDAMRIARVGHNSGDLWEAVGEKLVKIRQGIAERARVWYGQADKAAEGQLPDVTGLPERAQQFLDQMPETFQAKYPDVVKRIRDFAGVQEVDKQGNPTGKWKQEPVQPSFGQLHELRTYLRSNVNWYDLTPGIKDGAYKFFANRVDEALHTGGTPELELAGRLLDATDRWYGEQIRPLQDARIQAVIKGLESGLPADPKVLFDTIVKEGRSDLTRDIAAKVGPNLWAGVKAADVQNMLDNARSLVPGQIDGNAFARQVLDRYRLGMLEAVHGPDVTAKLLEQAQRVAMLSGKLDIPTRPGDTVLDVIARARNAEKIAKAAADKDPLKTLNTEMKRITNEQRKKLAQQRRTDPLGFIYDPTVGTNEAVNKILDKEDLMFAAAAQFRSDSPEFEMIRQVAAQRILMGTLNPGKGLSKLSPEMQSLLFPGAIGDDLHVLAKEMDFLMSARGVEDTAKSMAATTKVEQPWGPLLGAGAKYVPLKGFTEPVPRTILGKWYKMITNLVNEPMLMRFVLRGLKGDEAAREISRAALQRAMQRSVAAGAAGAAGGEAAYQMNQQP